MGKVDIQPASSPFLSEGPIQIQRAPQATVPNATSTTVTTPSDEAAREAIINRINSYAAQPTREVTPQILNSPMLQAPSIVEQHEKIIQSSMGSSTPKSSPIGMVFDRLRKKAA